MANESIINAFAQFWNYVIAKNDETLTSAKVYTDTKLNGVSSDKTQQSLNTDNTNRPILFSGTTTSDTTTNTTTYVYRNNSIYANPSTGVLTATTVNGAVWNDYAEYRMSDVLEPGRVVVETGNDDLVLSTERLQPGGNIVSDTFGFSIGKTNKCQAPIAVSGRVLAYPYEERTSYAPGDAVCAAPNGTVSKMTREEIKEYPERIIGTVSSVPTYETWGEGNVAVNGRIWIKIK